MTVTTWLIISSRGKVTARKTKPTVGPDSIAFKLNLELPKELFRRPQLQATISVPEGSVSQPIIDADVVDNIADIIEQKTGLKLEISLPPHEGVTVKAESGAEFTPTEYDSRPIGERHE